MSDPLQGIMEERARQDAKWGIQDHDDCSWLAILVEEVGEAASAVIKGAAVSNLDDEVTHVAAVALAWLECRQRAALAAEEKP